LNELQTHEDREKRQNEKGRRENEPMIRQAGKPKANLALVKKWGERKIASGVAS